MGYAAQWLDGLRVLVEKNTDSLLEQADAYLQKQLSAPSTVLPPPFDPDLSHVQEVQPQPCIPPSPVASDFYPLPLKQPPVLPPSPQPSASPSPQPTESPEECMRELRQLCPACFGGVKHGRLLEEYVGLKFSEDEKTNTSVPQRRRLSRSNGWQFPSSSSCFRG